MTAMQRERYSSGTSWEQLAGYSRAVRVGNRVFVSGTTATRADGSIDGPGDAAAQARRCMRNLQLALEALGASLADVVRTRIFVTAIDDWEAVAAVHGEYFAGVLPATTLVAVSALVHPDMLVEIEADAVVADG